MIFENYKGGEKNLKETPAEIRPNSDQWLEARLARLHEVQRQKVREFVEDMQIAKFSPWTVKANVQAILTLDLDGKAYEDLAHEDLVKWMRSLDSNGYREETIQSYRRRVKRFLRWVHGCKTVRDPTPELLKCVRVSKHKNELPEGVLSVAEIQRILAACGSQRNRALVHVGYESGCRAGELLGLRIRDVEFDHNGAAIVVRGKTGMRRVRLIESVHDLQLWLNAHPDRRDPEAWLWPSMNGRPLTDERFGGILKAAARKAGISKRIYPHLLRHTRATHLAKVLTEHQLRIYFGWTKTSDVPARYVHLSGRDVDDALLKHYGVFAEDGQKLCPRCGAQNQQGTPYCTRCSACLSTEEAVHVEERRMREEEVVAKVVKKLVELAPDLVERALQESGAISEIERVKAGVS